MYEDVSFGHGQAERLRGIGVLELEVGHIRNNYETGRDA
jgi:hypothetical protein